MTEQKKEETKKSTYLVTGGAGFIGSNLVRRLLKDGHKVIIIDNFTTGGYSNIDNLLVGLWDGTLKQILKRQDFNIDGIFHLGICSSDPLYRENPLQTGEAINDFLVLLDYAKVRNIPVVFASTSSLYNGNNPPYNESIPIKVKALYSETRYSMERLAELYYKLYNIPVIGLRFFSVYGPHEEYKKNLANLITQAIWAMNNGETFEIYGDGSQTRDSVYVDDIVEGLILSMNKLNETPICDFINLGTGQSKSLNEILDIIEKISNNTIKRKYIENPLKNYVQDTLADTAKAMMALNFTAKTTLEEGIKKTLDYYG